MIWNQETSRNQSSGTNPQNHRKNPMSLAIRSKRSSSSFVISKAPSRRTAYVSTFLTTILVGTNHPCLALIPLLQLQSQHLEKGLKFQRLDFWWKKHQKFQRKKNEKLQTFPNQLGLQLGYKSTSLCWCPDPLRFRKTMNTATVVREWFQSAVTGQCQIYFKTVARIPTSYGNMQLHPLACGGLPLFSLSPADFSVAQKIP